MLITLKRRDYSGYGAPKIHWSSCLPFVRNNSGKLIHRPRYGATYRENGCITEHFAIEYHCGQCCTDDIDGRKLEVIDAPEEHEIVCHRCEALAVERGLLSSEGIVGRHVHIGRTKAVKDCCGGDE